MSRAEPAPDAGAESDRNAGVAQPDAGDADAPVDDADELLGADLPRGTGDSVGGLMLDLVGRVPDAGDFVEVDGFRLTALDVRGRRIGRVRSEATGPPATERHAGAEGERAGGANHNGN